MLIYILLFSLFDINACFRETTSPDARVVSCTTCVFVINVEYGVFFHSRCLFRMTKFQLKLNFKSYFSSIDLKNENDEMKSILRAGIYCSLSPK